MNDHEITAFRQQKRKKTRRIFIYFSYLIVNESSVGRLPRISTKNLKIDNLYVAYETIGNEWKRQRARYYNLFIDHPYLLSSRQNGFFVFIWPVLLYLQNRCSCQYYELFNFIVSLIGSIKRISLYQIFNYFLRSSLCRTRSMIESLSEITHIYRQSDIDST